MEYRWLKHYPASTSPKVAQTDARNLSDMMMSRGQKFSSQIAMTQALPNGMSADMTFEEVEMLSDRFAVLLREELKLNQGDRVAVQMPNCLTYPIAVFGILKAGCILVNTNPLYTSAEMNHQFKDSGAKVVIIMDLFADRLEAALKGTAVSQVLMVSLVDYFPILKALIVDTVLRYVRKEIKSTSVASLPLNKKLKAFGGDRAAERISNRAKVESYLKPITRESTAVLQYTGGTTGVSKGAELTHGNLMANLMQFLEFLKHKVEEGRETMMTALPLYHVFAFTVNLLGFYYAGARNILIPSPRPLKNLKPAFEKFDVTWMTGVNTIFNGLCREDWFIQNPPKSLKAAVAGGMALMSATAELWVKVAKCPVVEGYGLTEASPVISFNPIGGLVKNGTIGVPMPSTVVECVDDNKNVVAVGAPGELRARGPQIMKGYWQRPDDTDAVLKDGWLYTGDIATMDEDGYLKIVDRKKEMILISGFNVYPNEVEDVIAKHPDVIECAVVGIPDDVTGESIRAYVNPKREGLTAAEIQTHCRQSLTGYKIPKSVVFKKDLPKTPIGKILRRVLRDEALKERG